MAIVFDQDEQVPVELEKTVLQQALDHGVSVTHICKGNARCSTCRVVVLDGEVPPRNEAEQKLADRLGFPGHVRLSCQLQASQPMRLRRVIKDQIDHQLLKQSNDAQERPLAVLFSDIRSFTSFSERHLPYDIVHILNRYFLSMGEAIHAHHGQIDKYMGDGIMALFGLQGDEHPAVLAYRAALAMQARLDDFNEYLSSTFDERFEIGVGIHYGDVVVGHLGHPDQVSFTAIGDSVNVAARIESATKGVSSLLMSEQAYKAIGDQGWGAVELELKGKSHALRLFGPGVDP